MGCGNSLFGNKSQYIKVNNGEFISVEGSNIFEKLMVSDTRFPYKQILKSRVILKAGQLNFLLNYLSLGDNATFLLIKATYDPKSVIEEDNYIQWSYYDDMGRVNYLSQMMLLTGNSINRIPQLYLSNPNTKYDVKLDVMVAVIDDNYSFYSDVVNQSGRSFIDIELVDIKTHIVGESFVIMDSGTPQRPLLYITYVNIQSIERTSDILTIYDSSVGPIFLKFIDEFNAIQAQSLISYILENPSVDIADIYPLEDILPPVIYFNERFDGNEYITMGGSTVSIPYNTLNGLSFETSLLLSDYSGLVSKQILIDNLIDNIVDLRDGSMNISTEQIIITDNLDNNQNSITSIGDYEITFDITDIALNNLDSVVVNITVN